MALQNPQWLARRGGKLFLASDHVTWFAILDQQWEYSLVSAPVQGKFACVIKQSNNGLQLPSGGTYATPDEALQGGIEDLRKALGW